MFKKIGLTICCLCCFGHAICENADCIADQLIDSDRSTKTASLSPLDAAKCHEIAELLSTHFAYSVEQISDLTLDEEENLCDRAGMVKKLRESGKNRLITFISDEPTLEYPESIVPREAQKKFAGDQEEFEKNYVRVYTMGNGLCSFHALGVQNTLFSKGVDALNPARKFPYFELADARSRLCDAYSDIYKKNLKKLEEQSSLYKNYENNKTDCADKTPNFHEYCVKLQKALANTENNSALVFEKERKESEKEESERKESTEGTERKEEAQKKKEDANNAQMILETFANIFELIGRNSHVLEKTSDFYYGRVEKILKDETGQPAKEKELLRQIRAALKNINAANLERFEKYVLGCAKNQNNARDIINANAAGMNIKNIKEDINKISLSLKQLLKVIPADVMLKYIAKGWPSHASIIPAMVNFSETLNRKVAFFYREIEDCEGNLLPLCKWTILDKHPKNADVVYDQVQALSDNKAVEKFIGEKFLPANEEELKTATDYVVLECSHVSRVIPRRFLEEVKQLLSEKKDIEVCTIDEQGNVL